MWYVYLLTDVATGRRTYVGATVDPARRLRQHNGELSGGARRTRSSRPWCFEAILTIGASAAEESDPCGGDPCGEAREMKCEALRVEYRLKHATPRSRTARRGHFEAHARETGRTLELLDASSGQMLHFFALPKV